MPAPPDSRSFLSLVKEIGGILTRYVGGQFRICLILSVIYAVGFALLGVPLWPLVALLCGFSHLIPMFGPVIAILIAAGLAWIARDVYHAMGVMGVFAVAQGIEGFYLTPRILGKRLHLPAIAVFIGLTIASLMFGFIGILITVPLMAIAAAIWRFYARKNAN
jgi:predicted PurR-regulated permease PerM